MSELSKNYYKRSKITLWLGGICFITILFVVMWLATEPNYRRLEKQDVQKSVQRAGELLGRPLQTLAGQNQDNAIWDDAYDFMVNPNPAFVQSNFPTSAFTSIQTEMVAFVRPSGELVYGQRVDLPTRRKEPLLPSFLAQLKPGKPLLNTDQPVSGFIRLPEGVYLVSSWPIRPSLGDQPARGVRVVARPIDQKLVGEIQTSLGLPVSLKLIDATDQHSLSSFVRAGMVCGEFGLSDIYGQPIAELEVMVPRAIYQQGIYSMTVAGILLALLALLALGLMGRQIGALEQEHRQRLALERRYRAVVQQASEGMLLIDPHNLRILEANSGLYQLLGYSHDDVSLSHFHNLLATSIGSLRGWVEQVHKQGSARLDAQVAKRKDGSGLDVDLSATLVASGRDSFILVVLHDISLHRRHQAQIEQMAYHDSLTGLPNRRLLQEHTEQTIAIAQREGWSLALLYLDLDRFKQINDSLGHDAGDELLVEVARTLLSCIRPGDTLARLGGDEFAMLLYHVTPQETRQVAERILSVLKKSYLLRSQSVQLGASIGLASYPEHGSSLVELLRAADIAMYQAKRSGGGWASFDPQRDPYNPERLEMERLLKDAIHGEVLEIHYQPIVNLANHQIEACEGLVRWQRDGNLMPTWSFVLLAEEMGLVFELDCLVLRRGLLQWQSWKEQGFSPQISLNLSTQTLARRELPQLVDQLLQQTQTPPHFLTLEITESAMIERPEDTLWVLGELKALGVKLALDDFGSGFASLAYLRRLPLDRLKLDRSLMPSLLEKDGLLMLACIVMGHGLGLEVVAEGVEHPEQLEWLQRHGCNYAQGYWLGRPMPANELLALALQPPESLALDGTP